MKRVKQYKKTESQAETIATLIQDKKYGTVVLRRISQYGYELVDEIA
jgi:hypothetical protein